MSHPHVPNPAESKHNSYVPKNTSFNSLSTSSLKIDNCHYRWSQYENLWLASLIKWLPSQEETGVVTCMALPPRHHLSKYILDPRHRLKDFEKNSLRHQIESFKISLVTSKFCLWETYFELRETSQGILVSRELRRASSQRAPILLVFYNYSPQGRRQLRHYQCHLPEIKNIGLAWAELAAWACHSNIPCFAKMLSEGTKHEVNWVGFVIFLILYGTALGLRWFKGSCFDGQHIVHCCTSCTVVNCFTAMWQFAHNAMVDNLKLN